MEKNSLIYVTGHSGLVGTALLNVLAQNGYENIITESHSKLDLRSKNQVYAFFEKYKPQYVFHLAAKVGGIFGNKTYPADFLAENIEINTNVITAAHEFGVKKLLNFGSVCIYPVHANTPIKEEYLLTGPLEVTNEAYAIAKITSLMLCKKYYEQYGDIFISAMPANLFGPHDNFHSQNAHVIPMLLERFHLAKLNKQENVTVWGSGNPTRDFLYSEDLAEALILLMNVYDKNEHINISNGIEVSIRQLAEEIKKVVGYEGELIFDISKPDGTPKRYMDITKISKLGWKAKNTLYEGLTKTYEWFLDNQENLTRK